MSNNSSMKQSPSTSKEVESLRKTVSNLRDINDRLEDEVSTLKSERHDWEIERIRLKRDLDIKDDTLNDLTRDLSLCKEAQVNAIRRFDKALEYNREVEEKMEQLRRGFDSERDELLGKLSEFKENLIAKEDEYFSGLALEKARLGALNEKLREKEGEIVDLVKECKSVNVKNERLEEQIIELSERNKHLEEKLIVKEDELSVLALEKAKLGVLNEELGVKLRVKEGKRDDPVDVRNEDWIREKARLEATVKAKEENIEKLTVRNAELDDVISWMSGMLNKEAADREKMKCLEKENREILAEYKMAEERFEKLEEDVIEHLCLNAKHDGKYGSSKIGKIVSDIIDALDKEQDGYGVTVEEEVDVGGNLEKDPAIVSHANGTESSPVTKSDEAMTTVISEEELSGENGSACNQNNHSGTVILVPDSDDDKASSDKASSDGHKRARLSGENGSACNQNNHSGTVIQIPDSDDDKASSDGHKRARPSSILKDENSSDGSLSKKPKIAIIDDKFSTPHKKTMPFMRGCEENLSKKLKTTGSEGNKSEVLKYMAKQHQNVLDSEIDMAVACQADPEFCVKAVCALYRNGLLCSGQRGSEKFDIDRVVALAKHLVDSDPSSDKKSVDVLKQRDPRGLDTFRKIARRFSDKLFELFKSNGDPFFSHSSRGMQYK